jgi:hypothetical protein
MFILGLIFSSITGLFLLVFVPFLADTFAHCVDMYTVAGSVGPPKPRSNIRTMRGGRYDEKISIKLFRSSLLILFLVLNQVMVQYCLGFFPPV